METMTYSNFLKRVKQTLRVGGGRDRFPFYYADLVGGRAAVVYNAQTNVCRVHTPNGVINWVNFNKPRKA